MNRNDLDETGNKALWVSWTRLSTWEACQQKAVFQMEGKGAVIKEGRNFVSGTAADRAMRKWLEQDEPQLAGQMAQYVEDAWIAQTRGPEAEYQITWKRDDPIKDEDRAKTLAIDAVNALEPFLFARVIPYDYTPEWRFKAAISIPDRSGKPRSVVLNGGADIVVHNPETDEWFVYDLKTTRNEKYVQGSTLAQLIFYQIALHLVVGAELDKTTTAFLTPACKTQYTSLNIDSDSRRHLMTRIVKFAQAIWADDDPICTLDDNQCYWCPMKSICPRWSNVLRVDDKGKHKVSLTATAEQRKDAERGQR